MEQDSKQKLHPTFDFSIVWNSLLLVTIIGLLLNTKEDIAAIGAILHEKEARIVQIEERIEQNDMNIIDLKIRVGTIEKRIEKK